MAKDEYSDTSGLLRGLTDQIEFRLRTHSPNDSIPVLIEHVKKLSTQASEQMRLSLSKAYPDIGWGRSEDKHVADQGSKPYWVYDPIDGAYHYLQGLPHWASTLALVIDGHAVMGQVYDPCTRELFYAEAGRGSYLNGRPISASMKSDLASSVVGMALPPYAAVSPSEHEEALNVMANVSRAVFITRQMAAASLQLAYVGTGRLDAYVETGTDVYDWLAAALIVQESGGVVSALDGSKFNLRSSGIVASASMLHKSIVANCTT